MQKQTFVAVSKKEFEQEITTRPLSDVITPSCEAFALLTWENNEEKWLDMMENHTSKSSVKTKYTDSGEVGDSKTSNNQWSEEGKRRFNELYDLVQADRKQNAKQYDEAYMQHKKDELRQRQKKRKQPPAHEQQARTPIADDWDMAVASAACLTWGDEDSAGLATQKASV